MNQVNSGLIPDEFRMQHDININFEHLTEILLAVLLPTDCMVEVALLDVYEHVGISFEKAFGSSYHVVLRSLTLDNFSKQPGISKQLYNLHPRKTKFHRT